jgi:hypothetical protein
MGHNVCPGIPLLRASHQNGASKRPWTFSDGASELRKLGKTAYGDRHRQLVAAG